MNLKRMRLRRHAKRSTKNDYNESQAWGSKKTNNHHTQSQHQLLQPRLPVLRLKVLIAEP
ncbi:hypothetical protein PMIT1342_02467 [Prochlorococcus marinus str. MIT 1342]|nr:hypothetical protein PMIT1342_02467 [Prochlorococcus marinus str. MIT 1342]